MSACLALVALVVPGAASGYSTRVHLTFANDLRDRLIASGGRTIPLELGDSNDVVRLSERDARAIIASPLAFRAGAIGPDNIVFPGMNDPSHGVGQKPFEQCELLYKAAVTDEERAYALGCFVHGATDSIAHHYVNYLAGETFTITPLASGRKQEFSNVIRHVAAESMIEEALLRGRPGAFDDGALTHSMPIAFVQRTYFKRDSALYAMMSKKSDDRYQRARSLRPSGRLNDILAASDLEPADHLVLAPMYLQWVDDSFSGLQKRFKSLQDRSSPDGSVLQVGAGADGRLGTTDDTTACTLTCELLYGEYWLYTYLMAPRFDAQGKELTSAFDMVTGKLHEDLATFVPTYLETVDRVSARLNTPYKLGEKKLDLDVMEAVDLFRPMEDWVVRVGTIDYDTIGRSLIPDAWNNFFAHLKRFGIRIGPIDIMRNVMGPIIQEMEKAVTDYVVAQGKELFHNYADAYRAQYAGAKVEFEERLRAGSPADGSTLLDNLEASGLFGHSFNVAAAALADHTAVVPKVSKDAVGIGPASFDASYSAHWMQVGLCEPLRKKVFPFGLGIRGILSMKGEDGSIREALVTDEARIECHDGSLTKFTASPTKDSCRVVELGALLSDTKHRGSVTRGYPPELSSTPATCTADEETSWLTTNDGDDVTVQRTTTTTGCGCVAAGSTGTRATGGLAALGAALGLFLLRRRSARAALGIAAAAVALGGCTTTSTSVEEEVIPGAKHASGDDDDVISKPGEPVEKLPPGLSPASQALLKKLGNSTWHGLGNRSGHLRAVELQFKSARLQWGEVQNPFGPSRRRELRTFTMDDSGTIHAVVTNRNEWTDKTANGRSADYKVVVIEGSPRKLDVSSEGMTEHYVEGATAAPTSGVTAVARTFTSGGLVDKAFCSASLFSATNYPGMFNFAREGNDASFEPQRGMDFVIGAELAEWSDPSGENRFTVGNIPGFDRNGGTLLTDQQNFYVHYRGTMSHPGGAFAMREANDVVAGGAWAFLGAAQVGSTLQSDIFLEVMDRPWPDLTYDAPSRVIGAGTVAFEVIIARCATTIEKVTMQGRVGGGAWRNMNEIPTTPVLDEKLLTQPF